MIAIEIEENAIARTDTGGAVSRKTEMQMVTQESNRPAAKVFELSLIDAVRGETALDTGVC